MDTISVGLSVDPLATASLEHSATSAAYVAAPESRDDGFAHSRMASADEAALPENPDLLSLPVLGRRTIAQHQRILLILLGLSVLVLAVVAYRALGQAEIGRAHV